jgi:hypothetical protein
MPNPIIERAARALYPKLSYGDRLRAHLPGPQITWEQLPDDFRDFYYANARAVLREIREPSEEMVRAGDSCLGIATSPVIWQAMIDAALEEG